LITFLRPKIESTISDAMIQLGVFVRILSVFSVFLSMWTQGQVHVLNTGQSVELDCEFYAEDFNMFNNPVIWKKFQRQEQADVNIMGNILPPFFVTRSFPGDTDQ
jgi:hypothetical protein